MPELARHAVRSLVKLMFNDDPAADTGAERVTYHVPHARPAPYAASASAMTVTSFAAITGSPKRFIIACIEPGTRPAGQVFSAGYDAFVAHKSRRADADPEDILPRALF